MGKALKILGLVVMLSLFIFVGIGIATLATDVIDSSTWVSILWTTLPPFIFGLLTGLAAPKLWLLSGVVALGYLAPGIAWCYDPGPTTLVEKLVFRICLPIVFAFLGGYVGKRLLPSIKKFFMLG